MIVDGAKYCPHCKQYKPVKEFYVSRNNKTDGLASYCKECKNKVMTQWKEDNIEQHRANNRFYYSKLIEGSPERVREYSRNSRDKYPHKNAARVTLNLAIKAGRIIRQPCQICGDINSHGHHRDYDKPLEVEWLCPVHHAERHKESRI